MPFPRFEKLATEKRERLLAAAAQEFASFGFEQASINRILEKAQMSKGAAYYYFADKSDLFFAVVQYCNQRLHLFDMQVEPTSLTAENFWPTFARLHREPLLRSFEQPWLFAAVQAAGQLSAEARQHEPLAELATQIMGWLKAIVQRGQDLGVIRRDIPDTLLFAWLQALDRASDQWLLAQWAQLDREMLAQVSDQTVDAMRRAVAPGE